MDCQSKVIAGTSNMKFLLFLYLAYATLATCKARRPQVYFDISSKGTPLGRVVFVLYDDIVPKTVNNFIHFCRKPEGKGYKGSKIHRVVKDSFVQAGDFLNGDGTGETSAYGTHFEDENFDLNHYQHNYILTMANKGPHTNTSQFAISINKRLGWLNGKHVAFGFVFSGKNVLDEISKVPVGKKDRPIDDIIITDCGVL